MKASVTLQAPARQRLMDGALAAALATWAVMDVVGPDSDPAGTAGLVVAALVMTVPLAWRRRAPAVVAVLLAVAVAVQSWVSAPPEAIWLLLATIVASYSLAAYDRSLRRSLALLALLALSVAVSIVQDTSDEPANIPPTLVIFVVVPWLAGRALHGRERHAHSLKVRVDTLERERDLAAREAVVEERTRIARELHDVVAHSLSVIAIQADAAEGALSRNPDLARQPLVAVKDTAREALREMRHLLGLLRVDDHTASLEPQPGLDAVSALVEQVRAAGLRVDLSVEGTPGQVAPGVDLAAFRIIQEGLTNTLKHARATRARVVVKYCTDSIQVAVRDDGVGDPGVGGAHTGQGLIGMRERVSLYGGTLDLSSTAQGFTVEARIPR